MAHKFLRKCKIDISNITLKALRDERGFALIAAILLALILTISSMAYLSMGSYEGDLIKNQLESSQAFYAAEAGVEQALWRLSQDPDWENWPTNYPAWVDDSGVESGDFWLSWNGSLSGGRDYNVKIRDNGVIQSKIVSSGSVGIFDREVELEIASAFDYVLFSSKNMGFQDGVLTVNSGNVHVGNGIGNPTFLNTPDPDTKISVGVPGSSYIYLPKLTQVPQLDLSIYESKWSSLSNNLSNNLDQLNNNDDGTLTDSEYKPDLGKDWTTVAGEQRFPVPPSTSARFTPPQTVSFYGDTTFSGAIKIDGNAVFGRVYDSSHGSTIINGDMVINGNAYFFNRVEINGHLYVTGSMHVQDCKNDYKYHYAPDNVSVDEDASQIDGILIQTNGGLFVRDGTLDLEKDESSGGFQINDYCYVNGDITIESNLDPPTLVVNLPTATTTTGAIYAKNGSLTVGNSTYPQDLSGWGKIVVGQDAAISNNLLANDNTKPMFMLVRNDLEIRGKVGTSDQTFFYGLVYSGGTLSRPAWVAPMTYVNGAIIADDCDNFFHGGYVGYVANAKQYMIDLGFDKKDLASPARWQE